MRTLIVGLLAATALSTAAYAQYDASQDIYHPSATAPAAGGIPFGQPTAPLSASEKAAIKAEADKIKRAKEEAAERARKKKEEAAAKARAAKEAAATHAAPALTEPAPAMINTPSTDDEAAPAMPDAGAAPTAPMGSAPVDNMTPPAAAPAAPEAMPAMPAPEGEAPATH